MAEQPSHDPFDAAACLEHIRARVNAQQVRVSLHAAQEMAAEGYGVDEVLAACLTASLLENYADHERGPCCLLCGTTPMGRAVHVVCTTSLPILILITVYEPLPPKWITPTQRREPQP